MKRMLRETARLTVVTLALCALFLAGCATGGGSGSPGAASTMPSHKYVCPSGPECGSFMSCDKAGTCVCGKPLVHRKVVAEDSTTFFVCSDPKCTTSAVDKNDPAKCACGKSLQAYPKNAKYTCVCGQGCDCNCISKKPGNCVCGKKMY